MGWLAPHLLEDLQVARACVMHKIASTLRKLVASSSIDKTRTTTETGQSTQCACEASPQDPTAE